MPLNNETGALDENSAEGDKALTMEVRNRGTSNNAEKSPKLPKVCTPIRAIYMQEYIVSWGGLQVASLETMVGQWSTEAWFGQSIDLTSHT